MGRDRILFVTGVMLSSWICPYDSLSHGRWAKNVI